MHTFFRIVTYTEATTVSALVEWSEGRAKKMLNSLENCILVMYEANDVPIILSCGILFDYETRIVSIQQSAHKKKDVNEAGD